MPRASLGDQWLSRSATDPALRFVDHLVRLLWFEIVTLANVAPTRGCIRIDGPVSSWVCKLVPIPETQAEPMLNRLQNLGLIQREAGEGVIWVVGAKDTARLAEVARINGSRGGRRRKDDTNESYLARRQTHLMMPISGGLEGSEETQAKPSLESSRAVPTTTSLEIPGGGSTAREAAISVSDPAVALAKELATLARIEPRAVMRDAELVAQWLAQGASAELLRQVVRTVSARQSYAPQQLNGRLGYFAGPLEDALKEQTASQPQHNPAPSRVDAAAAAEEVPPTPCHEPAATEAWQHVHTRLQTRLGADYRQLRGLALVSVRDGEAVVQMPTPSRFERDRAREAHGHVLVRLLQEAGLDVSTVQWQAAAQEAA